LPDGFPRCRPGGDRHLYLELGEGISPELNRWVHRTRGLIQATRVPGVAETAAAYNSILIRFDPLATDYKTLTRVCLAAARAAAGAGAGSTEEPEPESIIPVVYGDEWGPDLDDVAAHTGLTAEEVVRRHAGATYHVYMMGFAPGFAYLGGMDPALATPRLAAPRPRVPAGAVGIAGPQTGIYPSELPGGWRIIGRTPARLWHPERERPSLLAPGQRVRFVNAGAGRAGWRRAVKMCAAPEGRLEGPEAGARLAGRTGGSLRVPGETGGAVRLAVVLRPGPLDTIQDQGRWGFSHLGLPESGPLDWPAFRETNLAAGNPAGAAALEMTYGGPVLEFTAAAVIAVSRGGRGFLNGSPLPETAPVAVAEGDVLEFGRPERARTYLAVAGGLAGERALGSRATYLPARLGGAGGRALLAGDQLWAFIPAGRPASGGREWGRSPSRGGGAAALTRRQGGTHVVRAVVGPQDDLFPGEAVGGFFSRTWRVGTASDRRACLLEGRALPAPEGAGVSDGTPAGAVQVLPSGRPVVLLADHQTTGGYPKVAVVLTVDLPVLARAFPGDEVRFRPVRLEEAVQAWRELPKREACDWPGRGPAGGPAHGPGETRVVLSLTLGGRTHLVSVGGPAGER